MKFKIFILYVLLFSYNSLYAQHSFELLINTEQDEEIYNVIENTDNEFVAVGSRYYNSYTESVGIISVFNASGQIFKQKEIIIEDSLLGLSYIYQKINNNYLCIGKINASNENKRYIYICELDTDLNIIKSRQYNPGENIEDTDINGILKNSSNNIVIYGSAYETFPFMDKLLFEISQDLDSINMHIINTTYIGFVLSLIEKKNSSGYYALSGNSIYLEILDMDNNFDTLSYKEIPDNIHHYGNLKWFSDSTYIITGRKTHNNKYQDDDITCMILDTIQHNILHQNYFGTADTSDIPGRITSLDFIDKNNIYIAGIHIFYYENPNPPSAPMYDNYIFINKTDSLLNTKHEIFYGGDMGYYVWSVKATSDGGCIIAASRYDYEAQTYERDGLILKIDADGNLPASIEEPKIKAHELILYPNPGNLNINIRTAVQRIGGVFKMYNISGKQVLHKKIIQKITQINTEYLPAGVYIYSYYHKGKEIESGKWIKNAL